MARTSRLEVLNRVLSDGLVPLFFHPDPDTAVEVAMACARGGAQVVEFANRGEGAYAAFARLAERLPAAGSKAILGVGSVIDAPTAALFLAAGANFVVSPILNAEVARLCNLRKVAYLPGCSTPTEIAQAEELGAEIAKVFPGQVGGPEFIKAVMAPCPWHRLMPTGGI
jgi:2-dehydro-3-deoxyphosphogluconate aldolase/(4S)-4-hydroxy-2-oxoglutarate aldolase